VLVDPATLGERGRVGPHVGVRYSSLSPDGRWIATSTWGGSNVKVWETANRTLAWELPCPHAAVAFSPDGRWLVTALRDEYHLWHVGSWRHGVEIPAANGYTGTIGFPRDGKLLAVNRRGLVMLVDPETGRELATLNPPLEMPRAASRVSFSADGGMLAVAVDQQIIVWDLRLIRAQLAILGLDWDAPPIPDAEIASAKVQ
jgi:WD40 repeat protein